MKSLSKTLNEAFEGNISEASIDQYLEMISKDYQFDKKSDDYTGFLNTNPEDSGKFSSIAIELAENPKKYASALKKYGLSIKGATSKEEMVFVMESEDCDDDNVNEGNLLKQTNLSSAEYQKAKKLKDFNADDYSWDGDSQLYKKKSSTNENVNENMISDFLSTLTSSESQLLLGAIGATGVVLASVAADKLINYIKKNEGSAGSKLIGKLETLGASASSTVHHK